MISFRGIVIALIASSTAAWGNVMPNPDVSTPLAVSWWLEVMVLLLLSVWPGFVLVIVNRAFNKKAEADKAQNDRLLALEKKLNASELKGSERDREHDQKIHILEVAILKCQANENTRQGCFVQKEEHHGDILRLETQIGEKYDKLISSVTAVHSRVDDTYKQVTAALTALMVKQEQ